MTSRNIIQVFDQYQRARLAFVQSLADLALKPQNTILLEKTGVLELVRPLLCDPSPQVVQCAALALGRLVHHEATIAVQVINKNIIPVLLTSLYEGTKYQKQSILFVLRSICKHNVDCANAVIAAGGLQAFIACLEDFEASIKEAAAWGIGYIARQNRSLAQTCADAGAVPLLMLCLHEPEVSLKHIATSAISDVAKHSEGLAQNVVDTGVVHYLVKNLNNTDEKLKRQILTALSSCAKHNSELAEVVVEAEIFPSVLLHLAHPCPMVRCNAARLVRDIVKHSLELTQLVVNTGGIGALMETLYQNKDDTATKIAVVTALGYISGHSEQLAISVIGCKAIVMLAQILEESQEDALLSVAAWTVGQIGKHTPEHAQGVAAANLLPRLLALYLNKDSSEDLKTKCKTTLKMCLQKCLLISALEPLLYDAPSNILKYVLGQYSKVLPQDPKARRLFVTSGSLKKVQEMDAKPGTTLFEYISVINSCFPEEIVRFYSPGYPESLLEKIEQYTPQMMTVLRETKVEDDHMQTDTEEETSSDEGNDARH
ncbi:sperm-associated antigen 6-like [Anoplophora glabripennis]|uniref:sperm-associated antigen 6-like n=1 Tax=Anoplophora glabripennis TaxID=217634 RepID=UPI0008750239|nr:sperm-associated antigen 6-like [Anoplophora glabripennis]